MLACRSSEPLSQPVREKLVYILTLRKQRFALQHQLALTALVTAFLQDCEVLLTRLAGAELYIQLGSRLNPEKPWF